MPRCPAGSYNWPDNDDFCIETVTVNGKTTNYLDGGIVETGMINNTVNVMNHRRRIVPTIEITFFKLVNIQSVSIITTPCGE